MADGFQFNDLLRAMMQRESGGNPMAVSQKGATGLLQLRPEHAGDLYGSSAPSVFDVAREMGFDVPDESVKTAQGLLFDPEINWALGDPYMRDLLRSFGGNIDTALAAYNYGPDAMRKAIEAGQTVADMPKETVDYVGHVRRLYKDATGLDLPDTIDTMQLTRPQRRPVRGLLSEGN